MIIDTTPKLDFCDVLIKPKRSTIESRKQVDLKRIFHFKHSSVSMQPSIPIIAANMDTVGTMQMAKALIKNNVLSALHKHYTEEDLISFFDQVASITDTLSLSPPIFYSTGITDNDLEKLKRVEQQVEIPFICVDVANGYTERFVDTIKYLRDQYPASVIMAGNVVTAEMTEQLILSGADIVKVGIGSGSVCTTRVKTGIGYPQLSAIMECKDAAHGLDGLICSDGGCQVAGDVVKAFAAGADFVMLGGMLAGHDECGQLNQDGKFEYYGMSSDTAMKKHSGGTATYKASEGKKVFLEPKGPVCDTIQDILGGLRSACAYTGATKLKDLSKCTTFITVNRTHNTIYGDNINQK